jgi:hypothetical protein
MTPDIALCLWRSDKCVLADTCYRAIVEPDEWNQTYFAPDIRGKGCPYYSPTSTTPDDGSGKSS